MTQPTRTFLLAAACALTCAACDGSDPAPSAPDGPSPTRPTFGAAERGGDSDDDDDDGNGGSSAGGNSAGDAGTSMDAAGPLPEGGPGVGADAAADGSFGAFDDAMVGLLDGGTLNPGFNEAGAEAGPGEGGPADASAEGG